LHHIKESKKTDTNELNFHTSDQQSRAQEPREGQTMTSFGDRGAFSPDFSRNKIYDRKI